MFFFVFSCSTVQLYIFQIPFSFHAWLCLGSDSILFFVLVLASNKPLTTALLIFLCFFLKTVSQIRNISKGSVTEKFKHF